MDKDVKDLTVLFALFIMTGYGAWLFNSMTLLAAGITGGFTYLGIKYGMDSQVVAK